MGGKTFLWIIIIFEFIVIVFLFGVYFLSGKALIKSLPDDKQVKIDDLPRTQFEQVELHLPDLKKIDYQSFLKSGGEKNCKEGRVIKKPGHFRFYTGGTEVWVTDKTVVKVGQLRLSYETLSAITERFAIIESVLYQACIDLNREYKQSPRDKAVIMYILKRKYDTNEKLIQLLFLLDKVNSEFYEEEQIIQAMDSIENKTFRTSGPDAKAALDTTPTPEFGVSY